MTYDVKLVQVEGASGGLGNTAVLWPEMDFAYVLHSAWYCLPVMTPAGGGSITTGSVNSFEVNVGNVFGATPVCTVSLRNLGTVFYNGVFALPPNVRWNIIMSANCNTQTVQVYANDAPCALVSGGFSANMLMRDSTSQATVLDVGTAQDQYPAIADLWENVSLAFVDLSITANRRKFINADLTPVDLGVNGANPFGSSPPVFLTAPSVASDLATNFGTGGAFGVSLGITLAYQMAGTCPLPVAPIPGVPVPFCGDVHTTTSITAAWTPTGHDGESYTLDYRKVGDMSFTEVTGITDTSYLITGLDLASTYEFKVKTINGSSESAFSSLVQCSTLAIVALNMDNVLVQSLRTESPCTVAQFVTPPDVSPALGLRWSDTRGQTFGNAVPQEFGTDPLSQPQWNRTGMARDRVFELFWSAAYNTALNGAFVEVQAMKS